MTVRGNNLIFLPLQASLFYNEGLRAGNFFFGPTLRILEINNYCTESSVASVRPGNLQPMLPGLMFERRPAASDGH